MANGEKKGLGERGAEFFEKLHYGLGAAAIAGALIAPAEFMAPLALFGAYELAHGGLVNVIKNKFIKKNKAAKTSGRLALAHS